MKLFQKIKNTVTKVMTTKIGKTIFEVFNVIALALSTCYLYGNVNLILGTVMLFCLIATAVTLVDKYNKNKE